MSPEQATLSTSESGTAFSHMSVFDIYFLELSIARYCFVINRMNNAGHAFIHIQAWACIVGVF
jgi:hypothetical protein